MILTLSNLKKELQTLADKNQAVILQRFFKTGKGQYGEGDVFLGIKVPIQRKVAKKYTRLTLGDISQLLASPIHEYRLTALFILIAQYDRGNENDKQKIFELYLKNAKNVNNWDLVDLSSPNIVGKHLLQKNRVILYDLAKSKNLWKERIAILATFEFIKNGESKDALAIARILLNSDQDLIHKAVGWMLREIGKRIGEAAEEKFLKIHYRTMPRTMLRYAIERFSEEKRKRYLYGQI